MIPKKKFTNCLESRYGRFFFIYIITYIYYYIIYIYIFFRIILKKKKKSPSSSQSSFLSIQDHECSDRQYNDNLGEMLGGQRDARIHRREEGERQSTDHPYDQG